MMATPDFTFPKLLLVEVLHAQSNIQRTLQRTPSVWKPLQEGSCCQSESQLLRGGLELPLDQRDQRLASP